jgi:hypothetical protein
VKLQFRDLRWHEDITSLARREGWTVWEQSREQQRPHDPTFFAAKGGAVIAVWLRSSSPRPARVPPVDRFAGAGVRGFFWSPLDMASARAVLLTGDRPVSVAPGGVGPGDDAA